MSLLPAALLLAAWSPCAQAQPQVAVLDNGLRVVVERRAHVPEVVVLVHHDTGSRDEAEGAHGTTHLLEHLLYEGSVHAPDRALERTVQALGGTTNAWTSPDELVLFAEVPEGATERLLYLQADLLAGLAPLDPADLANQQSVVLRERAEWSAAPFGEEADVLGRALWPPGHPYHHPVLGTRAAVTGATDDALQQRHLDRMGPASTVLSIVGDIDEQAIFEDVQRWFGRVPARPPAPHPAAPQPLPPPAHRRVLHPTPGGRWALSWAWRGPAQDHADEPVMALLPALLSAGQGTPLDDGSFALGGLAASTASWWTGALGGQLELSVTLGQPRLPEAARLVREVVRALQRVGPSEAALRRAVELEVHALLDRLEDPVERAAFRARCVARGAAPACEHDRVAALRAVTPDRVQAVAQRHLDLDGGVQLSLVPVGKGGALSGSVPVDLP